MNSDYEILLDARGVEVECSTSLCTYHAMEQTNYDNPLCPIHWKDEQMWDSADEQRQDRGEYGQFETDGSVG